MQNHDMDDTMPVSPDAGETQRIERDAEQPEQSETQPVVSPPVGPEAEASRPPWARWAVIGVIVFVVISALGALGGYSSGMAQRAEESTKQAAVEAFTQYKLGEQDLDAGRCEIARQRFEYIVRDLNPEYPGVTEKLAHALTCANATATPEPLGSPTPSPTPDTRGAEELFQTIQTLMTDEDWDTLLTTLDTLRKNYPEYRPVDVDGLYYLALRNRGAKRILVDGDLEGGIFDLNRAEQFGPLDVEADSYRQWASWYLTGLSFWEVDWGQAITYFSQVAPVAPNLRDASFLTASDRLATAQVGYSADLIIQADHLLTARGWCDAHELYRQAEDYAPISPEVQPTMEWAAVKCELNPDQEPDTTPQP